MKRFRILEHTADIGIEAEADSRKGLFVAAAKGLREVLSASADEEIEEEIPFEIDGGDEGELLVNWLNEILYLLEIKNFFPIDFTIDDIGEGHLRARVGGTPFDSGRHPIDHEVKSATYHQLRVEELDGKWHARIYLDL